MDSKFFRVNVYPIETEDGTMWMAEYPELKGCVGGGSTPQEAIASAEENKDIYLEELQELGKPIPQPVNNNNYSGKFTVRISKTQHKKLSEYAENEGVSINQIVAEAIAQRVTMPSKQVNDLLKDFAVHAKDFTVRATNLLNEYSKFIVNTGKTIELTKTCLESYMVDKQNDWKKTNSVKRDMKIGGFINGFS